MKKIIKILFTVVILYVLFCLMVYVKPQYFFYNPTPVMSNLERAKAYGYNAVQVEYKSADGTDLFAWYTKPKPGHKVIVFMHGNSYNIEKFYHKMILLAEEGYGTFMPEYRGFGGIKGAINEKNLGADAVAAVKYLNSIGFENKDIIVYGMSLGSYMATNTVYLLQEHGAFAALVLEVPFTSLLDTVKQIVPIPLPCTLIMRDKYNNLDKIAAIKSPVLIMGGSEDPTVPVNLARTLYENAPEDKHLIVYDGGAHNDLYNFRNYMDIIKWLKEHKK